MTTQAQTLTKALCSHARLVNIGGGQFCQSCGLRVVRGSQDRPGAFCGREVDLVDQIKHTLELNKVAVFRIGQYAASHSNKTGTDGGVPDLWLLYCGRQLHMEVKVKGGKASETQQWLADEGYSVIVWSLDGAIDACNKELGTEIRL